PAESVIQYSMTRPSAIPRQPAGSSSTEMTEPGASAVAGAKPASSSDAVARAATIVARSGFFGTDSSLHQAAMILDECTDHRVGGRSDLPSGGQEFVDRREHRRVQVAVTSGADDGPEVDPARDEL